MVAVVTVPAHLVQPGSLQTKQLQHLHTQPSLGQSCQRQKSLASRHTRSLGLGPTLQPCELWPARLLSAGGFSRQEYYSILANTGCHALLEHYISCCPGRQLPWVRGAVRTPVTQAAAPPPHLALTGANPSPSRQPQEQIPVEDPYAAVEIKPQLKPRGHVGKDEDPKPSQQLHKLQMKSAGSTTQTVAGELWKATERPWKKTH